MWSSELRCRTALEVDSNTSKKRISLIFRDNVGVPIGLPLHWILQIIFLATCLYNPTASQVPPPPPPLWLSMDSTMFFQNVGIQLQNYMVSQSTRVQYILKPIGSKTYTNPSNYISVKMSSFTANTGIFTWTAHTNQNSFISFPKLFKSPSISCHISLCDNILISIFRISEYQEHQRVKYFQIPNNNPVKQCKYLKVREFYASFQICPHIS